MSHWVEVEDTNDAFTLPPRDQARVWWWDRMHFPTALSPLSSTVDASAFEGGYAKASTSIKSNILAIQVRIVNFYWYQTEISREPPLAAPTLESLVAQFDNLNDTFRNEILPEVRAINARLRYQPKTLSLNQLISHFERACKDRERIWELHFVALSPVMRLLNAIYDRLAQLSGDAHTFARYCIGLPYNRTLALARSLHRLARQARNSDRVYKLIRNVPASDLSIALQSVDEGRVFIQHLRRFLIAFGNRTGTSDMADPPWRDDPTPVYTLLKALLSSNDHPQDIVKNVCRRKPADLFRMHPEIASEALLRRAVEIAYTQSSVIEDHRHYIDEMNTSLMRIPMLRIGAELASCSALVNPIDIFCLLKQEVLNAGYDSTATQLKTTVLERRARWTRFRHVIPPLHIGTDPTYPGPYVPSSRFFGGPVAQSLDPFVLLGRAASPGWAVGRARVARRLEEASNLRPG